NMRTGKELLLASKEFAHENRVRSWSEILITLVLTGAVLAATLSESIPLVLRGVCSITCGLLYVRMFVIYQDYQHRALLQGSAVVRILMNAVGIYLLAPQTIWIRSH